MNTNETWEQTSDYKNAILFANAFLDEPYRDPDGNESTVARQFLRQIERTEYYRDLLSKERGEMEEEVQDIKNQHGYEDGGCTHTVYEVLDEVLALYKNKDK